MLTRVSLHTFFADTHRLANPKDIPAGQVNQRNFKIAGFNNLTLDHMVAKVTVIPSSRDYITLAAHGPMAEHLGDEIIGDSLILAGSTPVGEHHAIEYPRSSTNRFAMTFSGPKAGTVAYVNGQTVDWGRAMHLVLRMPASLPLRIRGVIGAIGITAPLYELDFSPLHLTQLAAGPIEKLSGKIKGWGYGSVSEVAEKLNMTILSGATGAVDVECNTTSTMIAAILGKGRISHSGIIVGDTILNLPGEGDIIVTRALGQVHTHRSGQGRIWVNGQEH